MAKKTKSPRKRAPGAGRPKGSLSEKQHPSCKLTAKLVEDICAVVRKGNFRYVALQRLGISRHTYDQWMTVGRKQIRDYEAGRRRNILMQGKLVLALDEAEGVVHGQMVEDILEHGSIQARQWFLERRFNKLYSRNPNAHIDDESGKEEKVDHAALLLERLVAAAKEGE